jgi:hypothetical protein
MSLEVDVDRPDPVARIHPDAGTLRPSARRASGMPPGNAVDFCRVGVRVDRSPDTDGSEKACARFQPHDRRSTLPWAYPANNVGTFACAIGGASITGGGVSTASVGVTTDGPATRGNRDSKGLGGEGRGRY